MMSEDELRAKIERLSEEGRDRSRMLEEHSRKLEAILVQATKTNGRVNGIEARERERDARLDKVEKRVWQVATAICIALPGVAKLAGIFTS